MRNSLLHGLVNSELYVVSVYSITSHYYTVSSSCTVNHSLELCTRPQVSIYEPRPLRKKSAQTKAVFSTIQWCFVLQHERQKLLLGGIYYMYTVCAWLNLRSLLSTSYLQAWIESQTFEEEGCTKQASDLASFPVSTPQFFFPHIIILLCAKKKLGSGDWERGY